MPHIPGHNEAIADPKLAGYRVKTKSDQDRLKVLLDLASQYENMPGREFLPDPIDISEIPEDRLTSYSPSQERIFRRRAEARADRERFDKFMSETSPGDVLTAASFVPGVGEVLDFVNIPYTAVTGKDMYSGTPMGPKEASAWALGGILLPNIIQGVGQRLIRGSRQSQELGGEFLNNLMNVSEDGGNVANYIPDDLLSAPPSTRESISEALDDFLEESIALDPDFTLDAADQIRQASDVIKRGSSKNLFKNLPDQIPAGVTRDGKALGSYKFSYVASDPNKIVYELHDPAGIRQTGNDVAGIVLERPDEAFPWDMTFVVPDGQNSKTTFELLQKVTDQIKVGERFSASLSTDSYPLFLRLVDRSDAVVFTNAVQYRPLNQMGRKGAGKVKKGILGLTADETQKIQGTNAFLKEDDAFIFATKINANLPAGLTVKIEEPMKGLFQILFPIPVVERVAERTSKAFLRKGGYVVKKKRKKGYSVKK